MKRPKDEHDPSYRHSSPTFKLFASPSPSPDHPLRPHKRIKSSPIQSPIPSSDLEAHSHAASSQEPLAGGDPVPDQNVSLSATFRQQIALLRLPADSRLRLRAIACINAHLDLLPPEGAERDFVIEALEQPLWKETDPLVAQHVVRVLASLATLGRQSELGEDALPGSFECQEISGPKCYLCRRSLVRNPDSKGAAETNTGPRGNKAEPALSLARTLVKYIRAENLPCRQSSSLKLQILRSLHHIADRTGTVEFEMLTPLCVELLQSSNPRLRAQFLQLVAVALREKAGTGNGACSAYEGDYVLRVLQEYTRDPHPCVREAALEALITIYKKGHMLTRDCYRCACALLQDLHDAVRLRALKLVGLWVSSVKEALQEGSVADQVNEAFLQISTMLMDMNKIVRTEACVILGHMRNASEELLLQTLSKKPVGPLSKEKEELDMDMAKPEHGLGIVDRSAQGVFVHGIEDEFPEVRISAIEALARLSVCSLRMRDGAVELLVDMLNDGSKDVRLRTICALRHIAHTTGLSVREIHLHMLHGVLEDTSQEMRTTGRNLLAEIQLPSMTSFKSTILALMNDLDKHFKDEGIIRSFHSLGRAYSSYVRFCADELLQEVRAHLNHELGLDEPRCRAIISLFVAAAKSDANIISLIPHKILSYARLIWHCLPSATSALEVDSFGLQTEFSRWIGVFNQPPFDEGIEPKPCNIVSWESSDGCKNAESLEVPQQKMNSNIPCCKTLFQDVVGNVVKTAHNVKKILEGDMFSIAQRVLSGCRKDLKGLTGKFEDLNFSTTFVLLYVECLSLILQGRSKFGLKDGARVGGSISLQELSDKLEFLVRCMRHSFVGHSDELFFQVVELSMVPYIWRVTSLNENLLCSCYNQLRLIMALAEQFVKKGLTCTPFIKEVREHLTNDEKLETLDMRKAACQLAASYWPESLAICYTLKELKAELIVPGSDFEHPVQFLPGVPLGITIDIFFNQIVSAFRLWVRSNTRTLLPQYTFLDQGGLLDSERGQHITTTVQISALPGTSKCVVKHTILLECPLDKLEEVNNSRGPAGYLLPLSLEKETHLISTERRLKNI